MRYLLIALLATAACVRSPRQHGVPADCHAPTGTPLSTLDSLQRARLVGAYRLVQVNTADPQAAPSARVTPLRLRLADSVERIAARAKRLGNVPRNVEMIGTRDWMSYGYVDQAELDGASLYLGCRACSDASPDILAVYAISEAGFVGGWMNPQSGITRVIRKDGSFGPNPAGHFCATRLQTGDR